MRYSSNIEWTCSSTSGMSMCTCWAVVPEMAASKGARKSTERILTTIERRRVGCLEGQRL